MSLPSYRSIIWDWNGTLLNDSHLCVQIVNEILPNHNDLQLDLDSYRQVFGFPITAYYERIGIDFSKESFEQLTHKFIGTYDSMIHKCDLHYHTTTVLNHLQNKGLQQHILTAAHKESVLSLLDHFSIRDYFKHIAGLDNHRAESKVKRGVDMIKHHSIDTKSTVMIGDTIHDYQVAQEIGVDCILIANGHQSRERLVAYSKSEIPVLNEINELLQLI